MGLGAKSPIRLHQRPLVRAERQSPVLPCDEAILSVALESVAGILRRAATAISASQQFGHAA